jgi:uncharacterized protein YbaP (TraB family)
MTTSLASRKEKAGSTVLTKRLNINLSDAAAEELEHLSEEFSLSKTTLVRAALGLLRVMLYEKKRNHRFAVMDTDGKILKEIVLPL